MIIFRSFCSQTRADERIEGSEVTSDLRYLTSGVLTTLTFLLSAIKPRTFPIHPSATQTTFVQQRRRALEFLLFPKSNVMNE